MVSENITSKQYSVHLHTLKRLINMNRNLLKQALESLEKEEIIKEILNLPEDELLPIAGRFLNTAKNSYSAEDLLSI